MQESVSYCQVKTILSKLRELDNFFGITYNMNVYRGCMHGCIYCDSRSDCYRIGDISKIIVKSNAPELLYRELKSKHGKYATIGTGSMNDPYMPIEEREKIVRKCMETIADFSFPVHVITKSDLVTRDIDLLKRISERYAAVSFTITCAQDSLSAKIEPSAPLTSMRFKAMERLASAGIYTGVTMMPLLPYLNDSTENITTIIQRAADCGASYIIPMFGVTMRKGSREYLYNKLDSIAPGLSLYYDKTYGEKYECFSPDYINLQKVFKQKLSEVKLSSRMKFYTQEPDNQLSLF